MYERYLTLLRMMEVEIKIQLCANLYLPDWHILGHCTLSHPGKDTEQQELSLPYKIINWYNHCGNFVLPGNLNVFTLSYQGTLV